MHGCLWCCNSKGQWHPLIHIISRKSLDPSHMVHCKLSQRGTLMVNLDARANSVANASPVCSDQVAQVDGGIGSLVKQSCVLGLQMQ